MLESFLETKEFPLENFLKELDKNQLVLLHIMSVDKNYERLISDMVSDLDGAEGFYEVIHRFAGNKLKKLSKAEIVEELYDRYNFEGLKSKMYSQILNSSAPIKNIISPSLMKAFDRFVSIVFYKRLAKYMQLLFESDEDIKDVTLSYHFENRPILNTLGSLCLLNTLDKSTDFQINENYSVIPELKLRLIQSIYETMDVVHIEELKHVKREMKKQENNLKKLEVKLGKKEELIAKLNETVKQYKAEAKKQIVPRKEDKIEQVPESELIKNMYIDLRKKDEVINKLTSDFNKLKEKPSGIYDTLINNLNNDIVSYKMLVKERTDEVKKLNKELEVLHSRSIVSIIEEYLRTNKLTEELINLLEPHVFEYQKEKQSEQESEEMCEHGYETFIGYCSIEDNEHYVNFLNKQKVRLTNLSPSTYLSEGQFVLVDTEGAFKWGYHSRYEEHDRDFSANEFGFVLYQNEEPYIKKGYGKTEKIKNIPVNIQLRDKQIISVDSNNQLVRFYKNMKLNADNHLASIKAKGQTAYYVLKIFPNGTMLRNIETGEELFKIIDVEEKGIKEQEIICLQGEDIVNIFSSSKFYTLSSYYDKGEFGNVEINGETVFIRKVSGELAIVNEIPPSLELNENEVIKVDEFNNFLYFKKEEFSSYSEERKIRLSQTNIKRKPTFQEKIETKAEVLLIGKITYENSYKMAMFKNGYRCEVIDGYSPWQKIKSALRDKDYVVVVTEFVSHDNMNNIKDENLDIPVIYPKEDGANRIVEHVIEAEVKKI